MLSLKKLLLETPEANPDDIFGEYIFGSQRLDEPANEEADTRDEFQFISGLKSHFRSLPYNDNVSVFLDDIFKLIKSGKYTKFLKPDDKHEYAYRLLCFLKIEQANELFDLNIKIRDIDNGIFDNPVVLSKKMRYTPHSSHNGMASWTVNKDYESFSTVADWFGQYKNIYEHIEPLIIAVVRSKIKENDFFLNFENLVNYTDEIIKFKNEKEVVSYGNVEIDKICYSVLFYDKSREQPKDPWNGKDNDYYANATRYDIFKIIKTLVNGI
jgi:hypothetical protein